MDFLRAVSDFIDDLADRGPNDVAVIELAPELERQMTVLLRRLRARIDEARCAPHTENRRASERRAPGSAPFDTNWALARRNVVAGGRAAAASSSALAIAHAIAPEITVAITPNISLHCIEAASLADVAAASAGTLYYLPSICRFAIRIADLVLCGNIGNVYVAEAYPQKVHDCAIYPHCGPNCRYYHNPLTCARRIGAPDIRNFVATSWLYIRARDDGSNCEQEARARTFLPRASDGKKTRKLSSREHLDEDLASVTSADLAYYNEQIMHDLLCAIIMNYYVRRV